MYNAKMGMACATAGWNLRREQELPVVARPMEGKPISAGLIEYSSGPIKPWTVKLPQGVTAKAFAITLEPEGGMPQPPGRWSLSGQSPDFSRAIILN